MNAPDPRPLAGKRAVVTGASRGIGRSIALAFAQAGAGVAITARSEDALARLAGEIQALGPYGLAVPCDVSDPEAVERMAAVVLRDMGGAAVPGNNARPSARPKLTGHPHELR